MRPTPTSPRPRSIRQNTRSVPIVHFLGLLRGVSSIFDRVLYGFIRPNTLHFMGADTQTTSRQLLPRVGLLAAPLLALLVYAVLGPRLGINLDEPPRLVAAVAVLMALWWLTEAIPLAATALVPLLLFPILGVANTKAAAAPYADPLIFLFLGGFLLGIAFEKSGLHARVALLTVWAVGSRPSALVAGVMLATACMSMWVSNTASAMMMIPIAASLVAMSTPLASASEKPPTSARPAAFEHCMYLGIAYAATIGGMATPIGTPPNAFAVSYLSRSHGIIVGFSDWMLAAMPLVAVLLPLIWVLLTKVLFPMRDLPPLAGRAFARSKLRQLGPLSGPEWTTLGVFVLAVTFWVGREPLCRVMGLVQTLPDGSKQALLTDTGVAIAAGLLLFLIPSGSRGERFVLAARDFERVPWSVLILFGGGLSLAAAMDSSGLTPTIGGLFAGLDGVPLIVLLLLVAGVVTLLSELASNTAVAATLIPVLASASEAMGVSPLLVILPATLACSLGFMLPVATPPNAIVYATGRVSSRGMMRAGLVVDIVAVAVLAGLYGTLGRLLIQGTN